MYRDMMPPVLARQAWVELMASRELMILEFLLGHMTLQRKELEGETTEVSVHM